jgi:hypothetical protein
MTGPGGGTRRKSTRAHDLKEKRNAYNASRGPKQSSGGGDFSVDFHIAALRHAGFTEVGIAGSTWITTLCSTAFPTKLHAHLPQVAEHRKGDRNGGPTWPDSIVVNSLAGVAEFASAPALGFPSIRDCGPLAAPAPVAKSGRAKRRIGRHTQRPSNCASRFTGRPSFVNSSDKLLDGQHYRRKLWDYAATSISIEKAGATACRGIHLAAWPDDGERNPARGARYRLGSPAAW